MLIKGEALIYIKCDVAYDNRVIRRTKRLCLSGNATINKRTCK